MLTDPHCFVSLLPLSPHRLFLSEFLLLSALPNALGILYSLGGLKLGSRPRLPLAALILLTPGPFAVKHLQESWDVPFCLEHTGSCLLGLGSVPWCRLFPIEPCNDLFCWDLLSSMLQVLMGFHKSMEVEFLLKHSQGSL